MKRRICDICESPLMGKKRHGFVVGGGRMVVCGDYRRHERMKHKRKFKYGEEQVQDGQEWKKDLTEPIPPAMI